MILKLKNIFPKALVLLIIIAIIFAISKFLPQRSIIIGAWTQGLFDTKTQKLQPEKLTQFEQLIHKKVKIAHFYRGWEALSDPGLISQFDSLRSNGWQPMINVNPYYFPGCPKTDIPLYKAIANGSCDQFLHTAGKNLSKVKQPFYLLFAWEMNNKQLEWSTDYTRSSPGDFAAAWRRIHTIFRQEHVTKVIWVFCPNTEDSSSISYDQIYPGNEFVDWIGLDGYNWGTTQSWSHWKTFSEVFGSSYKHITKIASDKPMLIAEVNTTDQGGDKSAWYLDMLTKQIPYNFPKIKAVVLYNEDRSQLEHVNWKIDITPETLRAFISGIHSKFYQ